MVTREHSPSSGFSAAPWSFGRVFRPGDFIGRYMLIRPLGEGGMGSVWLAHESEPPRSLALKFLRAGAAGWQAERLAIEARALARLSHEGIARLYGLDQIPETGEPFLVLEYVEGDPLLSWAQGKSLRAKLKLLIELCAALEHAHQRGVLHRDLKPDNILVTAEGKPKILDFGIARLKATSEDPERSARLTQAGFVIGTLRYMSPEQTYSDRDDLDTRSDLYSLALIGYELITGRLPYELPADHSSAITVIRESDARPLRHFDRRLKGDLEAIFSKALAKDRERRYPSVRAFAEDLERFLEARPVLAKPPSLLYRSRRFIQRNPLLSALSVMTVLAVLSGIAGVLLFAKRESEARALAELESARARASLNILKRAIIEGNPYETQARERTVGELLRTLAAEIEADQALDSESRFDLLLLLAEVHGTRGENEQQRQALKKAEALAGGDEGKRLRLAVREGRSSILEGRREEGLARLRTDLPRLAKLVPNDPIIVPAHLSAAEAAADLARFEEAANWLRLPVERPLEPHEEIGLSRSRARLAYRTGDAAKALSEAETALASARARLGERHPLAAGALVDAAFYAWEAGNLAKAEDAYRQAIAILEHTLGPEHPATVSALDNLASLMIEQARLTEAKVLLARIERALARFPPEEEAHFWLAHRRAYLLSLEGEVESAARERERAVALAERIFGQDAPETLGEMFNWANTLERLGRMEEALTVIARARHAASSAYPALSPTALRAEREWIAALRVRERLQEAERHMQALLPRVQAEMAADHPERLKLEVEALWLAYARGDDRLLARDLEPVLERAKRLWGEQEPRVLDLRLISALAQIRGKEPNLGEEALERLFAEAEASGLAAFGQKLCESAAAAFTALMQPEKAARWRERMMRLREKRALSSIAP